MDIASRARNIITQPGPEWAVIDGEPWSAADLYAKYLVPLGLIGPIASFIGLTVIGISIPFLGTYRMPFLSALTSAVVSFVALMIGIYVWALIIDALAPTFSGQKNLVSALKVAVFAATPALLAGIFSLLPMLGVFRIFAALYGLYLLYRGLPILMKSPPEKAFGYTALTVVCGIALGLVVGVLIAALHFTPFFNPTPQAFGDASDTTVTQSAIAGAIGSAAGGTPDSKAAAAAIAAGVVAAAKNAEAASNSAIPDTPSAQTSNAAAVDKNAAAGAAAGFAAIGALIGGGKAHVQAVDFHSLEALLPEAVGSLPRSDVRGERTSTAGLQVSTAEGNYGNADNRLNVKITDIANASGITALGKLALSAESESDSGYEKNVVIEGHNVHEKWTASGKHSELTAYVGDRYLLDVTGNGVEMPVAERAIGAVDFDKLAALK